MEPLPPPRRRGGTGGRGGRRRRRSAVGVPPAALRLPGRRLDRRRLHRPRRHEPADPRARRAHPRPARPGDLAVLAGRRGAGPVHGRRLAHRPLRGGPGGRGHRRHGGGARARGAGPRPPVHVGPRARRLPHSRRRAPTSTTTRPPTPSSPPPPATCRRCSWPSTGARLRRPGRCWTPRCSSGPAAASPWPTWTTGAPPATGVPTGSASTGAGASWTCADCALAAAHLADDRQGRPGPPGHPRRQRRRLHDPGGARLPRRVRRRRQPLRRRRPGAARPGHPQVRVPLPRLAGRPLPAGSRRPTGSAPPSTTWRASTGR